MSLRPHSNLSSKTNKPTDNTGRLLRTVDAARYLGVGKKRIHQLVLTGDLPHVQLKRGGNSPFLIDVRDLDRFIERAKSSTHI